jgi:hypothetical protein
MDYAAIAQTVLSHPLTWAGATLLAAPVVAWLLNLQLRALGLVRKPHHQGIAWNLVLSFLAFWLVITMGLGAVAEHAELDGLHWPLNTLANSLLGLLPAVLILAGAAHHRRARLDEVRDASVERQDEARGELRWIRLAAGALAALAVLGGGLLWPLLLLAAAGSVLWWVVSPGARTRTRAWRQSYRAGQRLRAEQAAGAGMEGPGDALTIVGSVGLISTDVLDDGQLRTMDNSELLLRVEEGSTASG